MNIEPKDCSYNLKFFKMLFPINIFLILFSLYNGWEKIFTSLISVEDEEPTFVDHRFISTENIWVFIFKFLSSI